MARHFVNRTVFNILVVMLTLCRLTQRVDGSPSSHGRNGSVITKGISFELPVVKENTLNSKGHHNSPRGDKRGWEAIELSRRKRDDSEIVNWKQREMDRGESQWDLVGRKDIEAANKKGWNSLRQNKKRGWDGIDFPWRKRSEKENIPKQKWDNVNIAFGKFSNANKDSKQERGRADKTITQASPTGSEESQHQDRDWDGTDWPRKRGWDGVDFLFNSDKEPNWRAWVGGDVTTGKRSADRKEPKRAWESVEYSPVNHSNKRGWDGIDFTFGKRSNDNESDKRGWDGVDFPFRRRSKSSDTKQDWTGMDLVLGVGLDTNRIQREKRGWEGLNFHYRFVNAYGPSQSSDDRKRGWEGVDTCACCHSNRWALCCLTCNRNDSKPKPRLTTKSYKDMFFVRDTFCKCCYATKVKDCCDLCEVMS